jgi:hypothetical protein
VTRGQVAGERGDTVPATTGEPTRPRSRHTRWRRAGAALAVGVVLVALAGAGWNWLGQTTTSYAGPHFNEGRNAVWLEHDWAGTAHSADEYDQLAARLAREQIRYVFAHVGPLDSDGTIPAARAPFAAALAQALKARVPGIQVLAWIGQVERSSGLPADETVDIANPDTRQAIGTTAAYFAGALGFDGVHYDIEPMLNNGPHLLDLLDVTRALLPPGKLLSISAPLWAPNAHMAEWLRSAIGKGAGLWTSYYYAAIATHVDQLVVMGYNTAMPTGALYQMGIKLETQHILDAARSARHPPEVLIGLPTYHENSFWFHDNAENLANGLPGVVAGLNSDRDTHPFVGVAIYRFGLTTDSDWNTYNRLWLGR